jgi:organic radical activating enzyme
MQNNSAERSLLNAYPVMESFYTIQGEGLNSGRAAYFIRLGGCDVGCVWCDVKESWNADVHPKKSVVELVEEAENFAGRLVVFTGGEPAMYNLDNLTETFKSKGFELAIETSGAYPITGAWNYICVSPKKFKAPLVEALQMANELKVVIYNKSDFSWAIQHANNVKENCALLLQPEYSKFDEIMPSIIDFVKENPKWRISLQTHKIIQVP